MKQIFTVALAMISLSAFAQLNFSGTVKDKRTGEALPFAKVSLENTATVHTDEKGVFELKNIQQANYNVEISFLGYAVLKDTIALTANLEKNYSLEAGEGCILPTVEITATKAKDKSGITFTNLDKSELNEKNLGQDLPYLLNQTPSTVVTSDAGNGIGYTGVRIRGSDANRTNVTINGIPVNDAESQGTYWVDLPDLISSVDNIQIQRGVGTSTNGAGAFGGSVNIQTFKLNPIPYAEVNSSFGSFNTIKNTVSFGTGLIKDKFSFDGRLSKINADGYIDRSFADLKSYYFSGAYYGKKSVLKFITFAGLEETYQSWYGVHKDSLEKNRTVNIAGMYLDSAGNIKYYDNEIDHYRQDYYQLHYSYLINNNLTANVALHYTYGAGYYEEYRQGDLFSAYGLPDVITPNDTITTTDLIRRKWLKNDFYGTTFSLNFNDGNNLSGTVGGAYNIYDGDHYGKIIWAKFASTSNINSNYYFDNALKKDVNGFVKVNYKVGEKLNLFVDLQTRSVDYSFLGYDDSLKNVQQSEKLNFINPKVGISYDVKKNANVYLFYGAGNKEPNRDDYTQSTPRSRPRHEILNDYELGYQHALKNVSWGGNVYFMDYKNQLVLTGEVNDVGAYNRSNVDKSYRAGIETQLAVKFLQRFEWNMNATFSKNKIKNFIEYTDNYDVGGQDSVIFSETDIAFSPSVIASSMLACEIVKGLKLSVITKYVGAQFLDNTSNKDRMIDAYLVNDLLLTCSIKPKFMREIELKFLVNNLLSEKYESNGYTYGYVYGGSRIQESFYYPQAGVNFLGGITLKF